MRGTGRRGSTLRRGATSRGAAVAVAMGAALLCAVAVIVGYEGISRAMIISRLACLLVVAVAGLTITWARPANAIGWLILASVLLQAVSMATGNYAEAQYAGDEAGRGAFAAAMLAEWTWFPSLLLPVAVLPSIYPTGRPESPLRKVLVWAGVGGMAGLCVEMALVLGPTDIAPEAQLPYSAPNWVNIAVVVPSAVALGFAVVGGLAAAVVRMVRASAPERQQLVWLLAALTPFVAFYFVSLPDGGAGYAFFGVAVMIGVLRYQLLDIHVVVRRTLFYVPLVVLVALVVAGVSTAVARLAPQGPVPLLVAAAVVAFLMGPVSALLRRAVDRLVLGDRADPLSTVGRLSALGSLTTTEDPLSSSLAALAEAVHLPFAAILDETEQPLAMLGEPVPDPLRLDLYDAGKRVGSLVIAPPTDKRGRLIITALLPHVAGLVRTRMLAEEVEEQRRRVDLATDAERQRIRGDLHDSLGPSLSGIALSLQATEAALVGKEPVARGILRRSRDDADVAVREIRRVIDALAPVALDRLRLDEAVQDSAARLGLGESGGPAFSCTVRATIPDEMAVVAYRIAGEAMHNVVRHADATQCAVTVVDREDCVRLSISDDGVGLCAGDGHGLGLTSMRRRAEATGGSFTIESRPDVAGTVVSVDLPRPVEVEP